MFKHVVNATLRAGLAARKAIEPAKGYRLEPASLGGARSGIDIDKALAWPMRRKIRNSM